MDGAHLVRLGRLAPALAGTAASVVSSALVTSGSVRDGHQLVIDNRRYDRSAPVKPRPSYTSRIRIATP